MATTNAEQIAHCIAGTQPNVRAVVIHKRRDAVLFSGSPENLRSMNIGNWLAWQVMVDGNAFDVDENGELHIKLDMTGLVSIVSPKRARALVLQSQKDTTHD